MPIHTSNSEEQHIPRLASPAAIIGIFPAVPSCVPSLSFNVCCLLKIHVADDDPFSLSRGGALEDVSLVKKYRMSEEDYDKRKGTLRCKSIDRIRIPHPNLCVPPPSPPFVRSRAPACSLSLLDGLSASLSVCLSDCLACLLVCTPTCLPPCFFA